MGGVLVFTVAGVNVGDGLQSWRRGWETGWYLRFWRRQWAPGS